MKRTHFLPQLNQSKHTHTHSLRRRRLPTPPITSRKTKHNHATNCSRFSHNPKPSATFGQMNFVESLWIVDDDPAHLPVRPDGRSHLDLQSPTFTNTVLSIEIETGYCHLFVHGNVMSCRCSRVGRIDYRPGEELFVTRGRRSTCVPALRGV